MNCRSNDSAAVNTSYPGYAQTTYADHIPTPSHRMRNFVTDPRICSTVQDYQADQIPTVEKDGVKVRVMAGESMGTKGGGLTPACLVMKS